MECIYSIQIIFPPNNVLDIVTFRPLGGIYNVFFQMQLFYTALVRPVPAIAHKCTRTTHLHMAQSKPYQILR